MLIESFSALIYYCLTWVMGICCINKHTYTQAHTNSNINLFLQPQLDLNVGSLIKNKKVFNYTLNQNKNSTPNRTK